MNTETVNPIPSTNCCRSPKNWVARIARPVNKCAQRAALVNARNARGRAPGHDELGIGLTVPELPVNV
jgi:hypothetical protein